MKNRFHSLAIFVSGVLDLGMAALAMCGKSTLIEFFTAGAARESRFLN